MTDLTDDELKSTLSAIACHRTHLRGVRKGAAKTLGRPEPMLKMYSSVIDELSAAEEKFRVELHGREKARR
jgi:hypothetical protein